ncbi:MAG: hypothetical protein KAU10_07780, partial [Dehalococcoidia bacterium]|nr:hypothetical protein [Dehalococcoidia bacterium]
MRKVNLNRTFAAKAFALVLLVSLVGCLLAVPVRADVPLGAEEVEETDLNPIWIYSEAEQLENLQKFVIEDNDVRGYKYGMEPIEDEFEIDGKAYQCPDGELGIGEVCVYRVMQLAIPQLWPIEEELPIQGDIEITWTHPCPGHEKAFRYITGDAAVYHKDIPAGTSKMNLTLDNYKYTFVRTDTGDEFTTRVLEGV